MVNINKVKKELRKLKSGKRYIFEVDLGQQRIAKVDLMTGSRLFDAYIREIGYSFIGICEKTTGFFISQFSIICKSKYKKSEEAIQR